MLMAPPGQEGCAAGVLVNRARAIVYEVHVRAVGELNVVQPQRTLRLDPKTLMKTSLVLAVSVLTLTACHRAAVTTATPANNVPTTPVVGTTMDGVYTVAQASRGEALYRTTCQRCHGADLAGGDDGAALKGPDFISDVGTMTVGQLHSQIQLTMPSDHPKTLSAQAVSDVISFILSQNGMPAGASELPPSADLLKGLKIATTKP
jgi:mono/diheme cytochrome c family protein